MAAPTPPTRLPNPTAAGRFVGQAVPRKEDPRLLTGRGRYTDDIDLPRMLHAHFVRSDLARAKITNLDVERGARTSGRRRRAHGRRPQPAGRGLDVPVDVPGRGRVHVADVPVVGRRRALRRRSGRADRRREPLPRGRRGRARRDRLRAASTRSSPTTPRSRATTSSTRTVPTTSLMEMAVPLSDEGREALDGATAQGVGELRAAPLQRGARWSAAR